MSNKPTLPDGLHADRLAPNRDNPREVAFDAQWRKEHEYSDLLDLLLRVPCSKGEAGSNYELACGGYWRHPLGPLGEPTERDRIIAATVIQWLGSNVGFRMLRDALARCGYGIKWPDHEPV